MSYLQVTTTTDSPESAQQLASALVEKKLAACVQVGGPITSTYRWQGKIETGKEWLLVAKTSAAAYPQVEATIVELHTYDQPEIIATEIVAGSPGYLTWLAEQVEL